MIGYQFTDLDILTPYLNVRQTRHELDETLEHRHVTDGNELLPDVEDYLQERGGVLIPRRTKVRAAPIRSPNNVIILTFPV